MSDPRLDRFLQWPYVLHGEDSKDRHCSYPARIGADMTMPTRHFCPVLTRPRAAKPPIQTMSWPFAQSLLDPRVGNEPRDGNQDVHGEGQAHIDRGQDDRQDTARN